ncbi:MAG TPA: GGDEF domain-containing protein [Cellvibrionaceae bacterium]
MEFFKKLADGSFMPHGHCLLWQSDLLILHVGGEVLTVIAYSLIPLSLIYLVMKRTDLAFNWIFLMFAGFIFLCGVTHLLSIINVWHGYYYIAGIAKVLTGIVSIATAAMCWKLMPKALAIPSNEVILRKNEQLLAAQQELIDANHLLEERVFQRTKDLERIAQTDDLTGLLNRGGLLDRLTSEIDRAERYNRKLSLLMIDLDHFKLVNDNHGHPVGDSVLSELATILIKESRSSDGIGRYGGEEFLIVLPETDISTAQTLATRIRLAVMENNFGTSVSMNLSLTCSIGVVELQDKQTLTELLKYVDDILYKAKHEGRNRVALADT